MNRRSCSLVLVVCAFWPAVQARGQSEQQPPLMAAASRTVLLFSRDNGDWFEDSVETVSAEGVVIHRRESSSGRLTESIRTFRRDATGLRLVDASGEQLIYPSPWPPSRRWEYVYRGRRYVYDPIRREVINAAGGRTVQRVLMTIENEADSRLNAAFDVWIDERLGIVRLAAVGGASPADYRLTSARIPPATIASANASSPTTTDPASSVGDSAPASAPAIQETSIPVGSYLGVGYWGAGMPAPYCTGCSRSGPMFTLRVGSRLGVRVRWAPALAKDSISITSAELSLGSILKPGGTILELSAGGAIINDQHEQATKLSNDARLTVGLTWGKTAVFGPIGFAIDVQWISGQSLSGSSSDRNAHANGDTWLFAGQFRTP